jgi:hypothetical protein
MSIYGGELALRVLGEFVSGEVFEFELFFVLPFFMPFVGFVTFPSSR